MNNKNRNNNAAEIIRQFFGKRFRKEVEEDVQKYLADNPRPEEIEEALLEEFSRMDYPANEDTYRMIENVNKIIGQPSEASQLKRVSLVRRLMRVAAVLMPLIIVCGAAYYFYSNKTEDIRQVVWTEVFVPNGQTREITLNDGTRIWLNAGSTLKYPDLEIEGERYVELKGEAYFNVTKDADNKLFRVQTEYFSVRVLGTEFNVNTYRDKQTAEVTLINGKVIVETRKKDTVSLKPGQLLVYNIQEDKNRVAEVNNTEDYSGWRTGALYFSDMTLREIVQNLERQHDVHISADEKLLTSELYTIRFYSGQDIEQRLHDLQLLIEDMNYQIDGNNIKLNKKQTIY